MKKLDSYNANFQLHLRQKIMQNDSEIKAIKIED